MIVSKKISVLHIEQIQSDWRKISSNKKNFMKNYVMKTKFTTTDVLIYVARCNYALRKKNCVNKNEKKFQAYFM